MQAHFRLTSFHLLWLFFLQALVSGNRLAADHADHNKPAATRQSHQNPSSNDKTNRWSMEASLRGNESIDFPDSDGPENKHGAKSKYEHSIKLDKSGKYLLQWKVLYPENKIIFALNINQTGAKEDEGEPAAAAVGREREFRPGWDIFGLGFSRDGHLASSDFCLVWYDLAHRIHLQDAKTDSDERLELIDGSRSFCSLISVGGGGGGLPAGGPAGGPPNEEVAASGGRGPVEGTWRAVEENGELSGSKAAPKVEVGGGGGGAGEKEHEGEEEAVEEEEALVEGGASRWSKGAPAERVPAEGDLDKQGVQIVFSRPLDVCSRTDYYQIDNGTTHLVWFRLAGPVLAIEGLKLGGTGGGAPVDGHKNGAHNNNESATRLESGLRRVQLIASGRGPGAATGRGAAPDNQRHHDVRMKEFPVPARDTVYWCKLFRLPRRLEARKHHITSYQALIEPASNEHIVHHMELFHCATGSGGANQEREEAELARLYKTGGWAGECGAPDRPAATKPCKRVLLAWAMGARPLIYPDQVGQAIGGPAFGSFAMLEVHYNNPSLIGGLVDSSGLRFHYTHRLRANEAGVMEVGLEYTDKNSIPPGLLAPLAGYCTGECTRVALGGGGGDGENQLAGVYVFAGQMHTHLAGVASWTEHYRSGKLLGELQRDNHYSPHFQEIRLLPEPVRLEPGDTLVHYCLYDTRQRQNITLGGFATTDEMCVTYLHYWPKTDLEVCKSSVDDEALRDYFGYLKAEEGQQGTGGSAVADNYRAISWSARRSRELLEFYAEAPLSVQCNRSNGDRFAGSWSGTPALQLWAPANPRGPQTLGPAAHRRRQLDGRQLMEYRGAGYGRRHAQCIGWAPEGRSWRPQ